MTIEPMVERITMPRGSKSFEWILMKAFVVDSDDPMLDGQLVTDERGTGNACGGMIRYPDRASYHSCAVHPAMFFVVEWADDD